jgi:hypothetical protein
LSRLLELQLYKPFSGYCQPKPGGGFSIAMTAHEDQAAIASNGYLCNRAQCKGSGEEQ